MKNPTGPWSLVRHMWARNFQQNPAGTVLSSVLAIGGLGLMLFFGFFIVMFLVVVGGLFMLAQTLLGAPRGAAGSSGPSTRHSSAREPLGEAIRKPQNNNALEGEYTVVDDESSRDSQG